MLISVCYKFLCTDAGRKQCDFEDVGLCQKNVRAEPLNGSTMPRAMVLSLVLKVTMCSFTIGSLLVKVIGLYRKDKKLSLLPQKATKDGKRQRFQQNKVPVCSVQWINYQIKVHLQGLSALRGKLSLLARGVWT